MSATAVQYSFERVEKKPRHWPRMKMPVQAELHLAARDVPIRTTTADLSLGRCYVEMMSTLNVGDSLEVVLRLDGYRLVTKARVVTSHPGFGNGIQFVEMGLEEQRRLAIFLRQVEVATPASLCIH